MDVKQMKLAVIYDSKSGGPSGACRFLNGRICIWLNGNFCFTGYSIRARQVDGISVFTIALSC